MKEILIIPATVDNRIFGNKNRILRVASYSRVSTNFEEQLKSFELQKSYYTDLILKTKGWKLAGTYADEGISGVTEKRPDFQKLMRHCRRGKIDLIITKSISRFSRNIVITIKCIRELKSLGIGIYFEKENINTLEESSEFVITVLATIAQEESNSLSRNIRKGIQMKYQQGIVDWNYSQQYGFKEGDNGEPEIIAKEAEIIRMIYRYYLSGDSDGEVVKKLNKAKIKTPQDKGKWQSSTVQGILQNERYCGDVILQKTYTENHITKKIKVNNGELPKIHIKNNHKGMISRAIYEQAILERAKRKNKASVSKDAMTEQGKYSGLYSLTDKLLCGCCLSHMQRVTWTKKLKKDQLEAEKQPVWRCTKRIKYGQEYCEESVTVDEQALHKAIMNAINATNTNRSNIIQFVKDEVELTLIQKKKDIFDVEQTQKLIDLLTLEVMEIIENGDISQNMELIKTKNDQALKLKEKIDEYKEKAGTKKIEETINEIDEFLNYNPTNYDEYDDKLVRQVVDVIKIVGADKIAVCFKNGLEYEQDMEVRIKPRNKVV